MPPASCALFQPLSLLLEQSAQSLQGSQHATLAPASHSTPMSSACLPSFPGTVTRPALSCHLDPSVNMASLGPPGSHSSKSPALLFGRAHLSTGHVLLFMLLSVYGLCPIPPCPLREQGPACFTTVSSVSTTEPGTQGALIKHLLSE